MGKVKPYGLDKKEKEETIMAMIGVIERLKTKQEITDFFLGLLTASEALMIARRVEIATMLLREKSFEEIKEKLKVGNTTIHKVEQWLYGGDEKVKNKLASKIVPEIENKKVNKRSRSHYSGLDRYAHHRFLKDLLGL